MTPDLARAIPGPEWCRARRAGAAERAAATPMPRPDEEIWRYSRVEEIDLGRFAYAPCTPTLAGADRCLSELGEADPVAPAPDVFAEWNAALCSPVVLRTRRGQVLDQPIVVDHVIAEGVATFPRLVIEAAADSELVVVERFRSAGLAAGLVVPVVELRARAGARVTYVAVNELGTAMWQVGHQMAWAERDSSVTLATVALGGDYARVRTEAVAEGQGSSTRQIALYFADGTQMHDFRTIQSHVAPRSTSNLLFKGAVKSVYGPFLRRHFAVDCV